MYIVYMIYPFVFMATQVPAKVSGVSAVPGVRSGRPTIRVTWSTPKSDEPISKYHLQYRKATASSWTAITLAPSETSTVLSGLDRGTVYHVQVRAISVVGSGPFSDRQQVTTHNGKKCEGANMCADPLQFRAYFYVIMTLW